TWWNTIVSPTGKEKTGYPTQKPRAIIERIVRVHSNPGDRLVDFFAGSGTLGEAAGRIGRDAVLVDEGRPAMEVMRKLIVWEVAGLDAGDDVELGEAGDVGLVDELAVLDAVVSGIQSTGW